MNRISTILISFSVFFNTKLVNSIAHQVYVQGSQIIQIQLILDGRHFIIQLLYLDNKTI